MILYGSERRVECTVNGGKTQGGPNAAYNQSILFLSRKGNSNCAIRTGCANCKVFVKIGEKWSASPGRKGQIDEVLRTHAQMLDFGRGVGLEWEHRHGVAYEKAPPCPVRPGGRVVRRRKENRNAPARTRQGKQEELIS